jgi:hypothetical protein
MATRVNRSSITPGRTFLSLLGGVLLTCLAPVAEADLKDTHHDFTAYPGSGEVCKPCHTPHVTEERSMDAPLWNHDVTSATFIPYNSPSMDAFPGQPTGTSKLCLSCHDGSLAIDSFGGRTGTVYITDPWYTETRLKTSAFIGTDLTGDHPISFAYDTSLSNQDLGLHDPGSTASGLGGTIAVDLLDDGRVECTSCHDPHIGRANGCGSDCHLGNTLSLWMDNTNSELCLTCHAK